MRDVIATYSHDDRQVRFLMRYAFASGLAVGIAIAGMLISH